MSRIHFHREPTQLVLTGKTFDVKETIKGLGGKWDARRRVWTLPLEADTDEVRKHLGAWTMAEEETAEEAMKAAAHAAVAAVEALMDAQHAKAAAKRRRVWEAEKGRVRRSVESGGYPWICCENCEVIDWVNRHTSCRVHAHWDGQSWCSFRINGTLYTGN
jgi:hypothetical protein